MSRVVPGVEAPRGYLAPLGLGATALLGTLAVAVRDPNVPGSWGQCAFLATTGWHCPGCGSLRAVHALTRGDVATAVSSNVLMIVVLAGLTIGWIGWLRHRRSGRVGPPPVPIWSGWFVLVAFPTFWVLRNLPWFTVLAP